jgi:hypothetical protein
MRWVYVLPGLHLCAFAMANIGYLIPLLQHLGILDTYLIAADLPVSFVVFAFAWRYRVLAAIWIMVVGTLWWYFLSRLLEIGVRKFLRKDPPFPGLKF